MDRRRLVAAMLEGHPLCAASLKGVCTGYATEVHEVLSRARGGDILDPDNCLALCHSCHRWVTEHPREATELGLLRSQYEKSRQGP